jgi:hypothetical protein
VTRRLLLLFLSLLVPLLWAHAPLLLLLRLPAPNSWRGRLQRILMWRHQTRVSRALLLTRPPSTPQRRLLRLCRLLTCLRSPPLRLRAALQAPCLLRRHAHVTPRALRLKATGARPAATPANQAQCRHPLPTRVSQAQGQRPAATPANQAQCRHPLPTRVSQAQDQQPASTHSSQAQGQHPLSTPVSQAQGQQPSATPASQAQGQHPLSTLVSQAQGQQPAASPASQAYHLHMLRTSYYTCTKQRQGRHRMYYP